MDPSEIQSIMQYMQTFGHAPPGITPQNLQLVQALQAAKQRPAVAAPTMPPPTFNRATPGISGAISDAVKAVSGAVAPKAITQQNARLAAQEAASQ